MNVVKSSYTYFEDFFHHALPTGELGQMFDGAFDKFLFRGEPSGKYELIPSALRKGAGKLLNTVGGGIDAKCLGEQIRQERYKLWDFYKIANQHGLKVTGSESMRNEYLSSMSQTFGFQEEPYKWLSSEYEDLAALAQHYGVPTRLLDWTSELFVALYFASVGALQNWKNDKDKHDSSDVMVIWMLNGGLIHSMSTERREGVPEIVNGELKKTVVNPLPLKLVVPPYYDNPNLNAQKGVLSYWQIDMPSRNDELNCGSQSFPIDKLPLNEMLGTFELGYNSDHIDILYKAELNINECGEMYRIMNSLGYNAAKLFPGYDGVKRKMQEDDICQEFFAWLQKKQCQECEKHRTESETNKR
jgi:hypothetical protein